jgi:hypothetical protein
MSTERIPTRVRAVRRRVWSSLERIVSNATRVGIKWAS